MSQSKEYDAAMVVPESITVITQEGNLHLMTELVLQIKEFTRKIEAEDEQIAIWKRRLEASRSSGDLALLEDIETRIKEHTRKKLDAEMERSTLEDKKAELRFQGRGPSAEQKFRTAQAQALVNQFAEFGISAEDEQVKKQLVHVEANSALDTLKERMNAGKSIASLQPSQQITVTVTAAPNATLTPGDIRRGAVLNPKLVIKDSTFQRIDAINFGKDAPAAKYQFQISPKHEVKTLSSNFPNGRTLTDDGLCTSGEISFQLGDFALRQSVLLIFRVDAAEAQLVETTINGVTMQGSPIEKDQTTRWRHQTILVPAEQVTTAQLQIVRRSTESARVSLYAVWAYQDAKKPETLVTTEQSAQETAEKPHVQEAVVQPCTDTTAMPQPTTVETTATVQQPQEANAIDPSIAAEIEALLQQSSEKEASKENGEVRETR